MFSAFLVTSVTRLLLYMCEADIYRDGYLLCGLLASISGVYETLFDIECGCSPG